MKKVLILTHEEDPHASYVSKHLKDAGILFFQVNTDKLIGNYHLTFDSKSGLYVIKTKGKEFSIDREWSIWNRRVMDPELPKDFPKELEDIVFTETERTWDGLLFTHAGRVVNKPQAGFAANNKVDQLCFARDYDNGIEIPETLLTNDPGALRSFFQEKSPICHKLQKAALVKRGEEYFTTYNNLISQQQMEQAELIERNPSLFQTYINKEYELRITALEHKVVGIAIHSQDSAQSRLDYRRYDFDNVRYNHIELPDFVTSFCTAMLKHYGLLFGEFDFIYTKDSKYFFLELNPNGQWLWLELKSKYPLSKDVADNLVGIS